MILSAGFCRSIDAATAAAMTAQLDPVIRRVGVVVNESPEQAAALAEAAGADILQLHGQEDAAYLVALRKRWRGFIWKAVRVQTVEDLQAADAMGADCLVVEGYTPGQVGGTGQTANWSLLATYTPTTPWLLAGGLHAGNLRQALEVVHPNGVDLSSGIETDGKKDAEKMQQVLNIIRGE